MNNDIENKMNNNDIDNIDSYKFPLINNTYQSFLWYQKPIIGLNNNDNSNQSPIQIIYPTGEIALGVPVNESSNNNNNNNNRSRLLQKVTVASGPENGQIDQFYRRCIVFAFVIFALINFIITIYLFTKASIVDPSKVELPSTTTNSHEISPNDFQAIGTERRTIEKINFVFTLIIIIIGTLSSIFQNVLGLSIYALAITLNFILRYYYYYYYLTINYYYIIISFLVPIHYHTLFIQLDLF
jgi:hypothetical protein